MRPPLTPWRTRTTSNAAKEGTMAKARKQRSERNRPARTTRPAPSRSAAEARAELIWRRKLPRCRCAESSADPALGDATMGRFTFHTSSHRWHVDYPKGDRLMRQLWVLVSLAGLVLTVAIPATAQVVSLGTLRAIDPKDAAAVTVECEKSADGSQMTCGFVHVKVSRVKTPEAARAELENNLKQQPFEATTKAVWATRRTSPPSTET